MSQKIPRQRTKSWNSENGREIEARLLRARFRMIMMRISLEACQSLLEKALKQQIRALQGM